MSNEFKPFVPPNTKTREFTIRALVIGLFMCVILGAANAYLGLRAGMTIAATYPAAIIGMALLRFFKGSILEENMARTVGSIGESVAAGAIFTIPAFLISGAWQKFDSPAAYIQSTVLMMVGGILGILFVTVLRKIMVEDKDLPFPESVAAAEIHKAGRAGMSGAKPLFIAMIVGAIVYILGAIKLFAATAIDFTIKIGTMGKSFIRLGGETSTNMVSTGGVTMFSAPAISPAYLGVGYIIGPKLGALNFAGGLLAWGLFVPMLIYFLGPQLEPMLRAQAGGDPNTPLVWGGMIVAVWKYIVRPIAVGGMLVGACFTLYKMRKNLITGVKRAVTDVKKAVAQTGGAKEVKNTGSEEVSQPDKDLNLKGVFIGLIVTICVMVVVYNYFAGTISGAIAAAIVMAIAGFFFAAVSGNLVGMIGSSNNPISGLTLATLILSALLMVIIGVSGMKGVAAVLGIAAVVCVSSAVAGEMLQDLKVGHILGGTPKKMQIGDFIGVIVASLVMYFPLLVLHVGNINAGGIGFGDPALPAPQAGLMAALSKGIVGGTMAWPLVIIGIVMGIALILVQVKSPMLFSVGMYLPLETTFAIFVGGLIKGISDSAIQKRKLNDAQKVRVENTGVLIASGLISGEALMGLVIAGLSFAKISIPEIFADVTSAPALIGGAIVLVFLGMYLVRVPLAHAGKADEPAPPSAVM